MKVKQMTGLLCMAFILLLSACNNPVSPDNGGDGGTNPGGGTSTYVRFVNTAKYAVTVYADVSLLKELVTVEANKSKTIASEASTSGVAFYPKYHVDIESIKIPYPGAALVTRVDAGKTTEVTVADLTAFATSSAYIKVENASTDSLTLNRGNTELSPEGSSSTILLQNEIGIYEIAPGSTSLYKLMKNTSIPVTLPAELEQFDRGYIYVLKYTNNRLELTKKLSIKQEIIPLAAPANVSASVLANAQIKITWTAVTGAGGYRIYRSTALSGTYTLADTVNAGVVEYTDTGLTYNTEYYYKVASIYESGEVTESVSAAVSVTLVFPVPANVSAIVLLNAQVKITWTAVTGAGGYRIYRSTALSGTYTLADTVNAGVVEYTDTGLTYNTEYYYKVASIYESGEVTESVSAAVSVTLVFPVPANVSAIVLLNAQVKITWSAVAEASGYRVYRSTALNGTYTFAGTVNAGVVEYTDTGLTNNNPVSYYKVASIYEGVSIAESVSAAVFVNLVFPNMKFVEGGNFKRNNDTVTVDSFYMNKYEVTQKEWVAVMGNNPSNFKGDALPVENVIWYDVIDYCNRLSIKEGLDVVYSGTGDTTRMDITANGYRLPTEAEWEYAARGGKHHEGYEYSGSNNLDSVGWYWQNSGDTWLSGTDDDWDYDKIVANNGRTWSVGAKVPNALDLYDMSGNVWEWCWDWYGTYDTKSQANPAGPTSGSHRVGRGGGWHSDASGCRVSSRSSSSPGNRSGSLGFRPVRSVR